MFKTTLLIVTSLALAQDSVTWHKKREPNKDCVWVSEFVPTRCTVVGADDSKAMEACPDACYMMFDDIDEELTMEEIDAGIMRLYKGGQFNECPVETMYWEHPEDVYGGFSGCVSEQLFTPCDQDGFDSDAMEAGTLPYMFNASTGECTPTGVTTENRTFWIIWGLPTDGNTLIEKTGMNPVVKFPLLRSTYPTYTWQGAEIADDSSAIPVMKEWMVYLGIMTEEMTEDFGIQMTEGAEAGMVTMIAAKVLEMASQSCNRHFCQLMQAPAYGYSPTNSALLANQNKRYFMTEGCPDEDDPEDITITRMGWFPGNPLPTCVGFDNVTYSADSSDPNSPWYETMVFPENPSGELKTPQLPDSNRRVCDGVYLYPMFFGMTDNVIPDIPDCSAWALSATKCYSASVRTGFIAYKLEPESNAQFMQEINSDLTSLTYGDYSEWSWWGHMQINEMLMAKPVDDPTSWIGAYTEIQNEKWASIIEGFEGCPYIEVTNPNAGAYVWFRMLDPYLGAHDGLSEPSFFASTMGVRATTYWFGFRGADPSTYYGEGYTTYDFVRLQLFRDVFVYEEVGRRAGIVCNGGTVDGYMSGEEWADMQESRRRRRLSTGDHRMTFDEHKELIAAHAPRLSDQQIHYHAKLSHNSQVAHDDVHVNCAPEFTTSCVMRYSGGRNQPDAFVPM